LIPFASSFLDLFFAVEGHRLLPVEFPSAFVETKASVICRYSDEKLPLVLNRLKDSRALCLMAIAPLSFAPPGPGRSSAWAEANR